MDRDEKNCSYAIYISLNIAIYITLWMRET